MSTIPTQVEVAEKVRESLPTTDRLVRLWADSGARPTRGPDAWLALATLASMEQNRWPGE